MKKWRLKYALLYTVIELLLLGPISLHMFVFFASEIEAYAYNLPEPTVTGKSGITAHPSRRDGMLFRFSGMIPDNNKIYEDFLISRPLHSRR